MRFPRPKFSLLTLLLLSCAAGSGIGVYLKSEPWVVKSSIYFVKDLGLPEGEQSFNAKFLADGQRFLFEVGDRTFLYDLDGRRCMTGHIPQGVRNVSASYDGRWIFSGDSEGKGHVDVYEIRTGKKVLRVPAEIYWDIYTVNPTETYLVNVNSASIWNFKTGAVIFNQSSIGLKGCFPSPEALKKCEEVRVQVLPEALKATTLVEFSKAARGPVVISEINKGEEFYPYGVHAATAVTWDGSLIATQFPNHPEVQFWDGNSLKLRAKITIPTDSWLQAITTDGRTLIVRQQERKNLAFVEATTGRLLKTLLPPRNCPDLYSTDIVGVSGNELEVKYRYDENPKEPKSEPIYYYRRINLTSLAILYEGFDEWSPTQNDRFPDETRKIENRFRILDAKSDEELFAFSFDEESIQSLEVLACAPDNVHCLIATDNRLDIYKRVRPEWWWGYFYLPETWLCIAFSLATLTSLFKTRARTA